jgi:hypothetical protein
VEEGVKQQVLAGCFRFWPSAASRPFSIAPEGTWAIEKFVFCVPFVTRNYFRRHRQDHPVIWAPQPEACSHGIATIIHLKCAPLVVAVDASGNVSIRQSCPVPLKDHDDRDRDDKEGDE